MSNRPEEPFVVEAFWKAAKLEFKVNRRWRIPPWVRHRGAMFGTSIIAMTLLAWASAPAAAYWAVLATCVLGVVARK